MLKQTPYQRPIYECVVADDPRGWKNTHRNAKVTPPIPDKPCRPKNILLDQQTFPSSFDLETRSDDPYEVI